MSGRDAVPFHIREARRHIDADRWDKSNRRLRDVAQGTTREENTERFNDSYRWLDDESNRLSEVAVAAVRERLRKTAVVPDALTIPCREHAATVGQFCGRGLTYVCGARLALSRRAS